jgi:hypothetical protein
MKNTITVETPEVVSLQQPNHFHRDGAWSLYDDKGNLFGSATSSNLYCLHDAIQLAVELSESGESVTVRWEDERI